MEWPYRSASKPQTVLASRRWARWQPNVESVPKPGDFRRGGALSDFPERVGGEYGLQAHRTGAIRRIPTSFDDTAPGVSLIG
jgi:hypothetical protein